MKKADTRKSMQKYAAGALLFTILVILVANGSYIFMQWLIGDVLEISNRYLASELVFIGTLVIVNIVLIIGLVILYRKRHRELTTLSEGIERVAAGDFSVRLQYREKDSMADVYKNFNKMSKDLESLVLLREDFINNFSHEFKTPIASINGFASLLLEKELSKEAQREYLSIIKEESERLSRLTSNTLLLSKLSSSNIITEKQQYDLGEQLRQCSIILSQEWLDKRQSFSGDIENVAFVGNYDLMQHLWINIIGNAVKYTPIGGEISIGLKEEGDKAVVCISDTGFGMDEETLDHIFDPYYQSDKTHSKEGMGLGLSIVKQIVDLCEGRIEVKSKINEGSEFTIYLPTGLAG